LPRSVVVVHVEAVYFQCSRAILRSGLWDPARKIARETLPSIGTILADLSKSAIDGPTYDATFEKRIMTTLY
jgi:hypothetical protein